MAETRYVTLDSITTLDYEITEIYAEKQKWSDGVLFRKDTPRRKSALIFLSGCTGEYRSLDSDIGFFAPCKSLIFLPYMSRYTVLNISSGLSDTDALYVEFNMECGGEILAVGRSPFIVENANRYLVSERIGNAVKEYESVVRSPSALKAEVYSLLTCLRDCRRLDRRFASILPAIQYLEGNVSAELKVFELADMCGLSEGGFRRLFREYSGKSPTEYMIGARLEAARGLLDNSSYTVETISEMLNFESSSYFCKLFKRKLGMTPMEYRRSGV
jgi:AraC-like DNA-binding protein